MSGVVEVAAGVLRVEQPDGERIVCQYVVHDALQRLVVDTGLPEPGGNPLVRVLRELAGDDDRGDGLTVVLTHPDADHCGGTAALLARWPRARILAGAADCELLGRPELTIAARYEQFAAEGLGLDEDGRARSLGRFGGAFRTPEAVADRHVITVGRRDATVLALPGHSPGHVGVWLAGAGIAITGDAVLGNGIPNLDGSLRFAPQYAPPAVYRATIARLRELPIELLLTGHEPPLAGDAVAAFLERSLAAADRLDGMVVAALAERSVPATLADLGRDVARAYGAPAPGEEQSIAVTIDGILRALVDAARAALTPAREGRSIAAYSAIAPPK